MKAMIAALVFCLTAPAFGDIYRYEDGDGVIHFSDAPTSKNYQPFLKRPPTKQLTPGKLLCKLTDRHGELWAVRATDDRLSFLWYMHGKREIAIVTKSGLYIPSIGFANLVDDGVTVGSNPVIHWPKGSPGYQCYMAVKSAMG